MALNRLARRGSAGRGGRGEVGLRVVVQQSNARERPEGDHGFSQESFGSQLGMEHTGSVIPPQVAIVAVVTVVAQHQIGALFHHIGWPLVGQVDS